MRCQDIQCPLLAGLCTAAVLLAVMMTAGCVTGPRKIAIAPDVRLKLNEAPEIIVFRYGHPAVLVALTGLAGKDTYRNTAVKDEPLIPLQEGFISAVKAELKLDNIRTLPEPRHHDPDYRFRLDRYREQTRDLVLLQRTFQTGLVFEFDRDGIVFGLDPYSTHLHPITSGNVHYRVHLWAKVSLIRVNEKNILWQGVCDITEGGLIRDDFQDSSDTTAIKVSALVQEKLDKSIKACVQEWTAQFMGQ